jgi:calcineurin-like phosphoesterase family protein
MSCYLIGDPHLSHKNIANFRTFVSSPEDNEKLFVDSWTNTIKKQDIVFVLGDVTFDKAGLDLLGNLKGRKILVKGNHDIEVSTADMDAKLLTRNI